MKVSLVHMNGSYPPEMLLTGKVNPWTAEYCVLTGSESDLVVSLTTLENELTFYNIRAQEGDDIAKAIYPDAPWHNATDYSQGGQAEIPDGPLDTPNMGSNNWAISSALTKSGSTIVCNDPHVPVTPAPTYWHCSLYTSDAPAQ